MNLNEASETALDIRFAAERAIKATGNERACFEHFIEVNRERLTRMIGEGHALSVDITEMPIPEPPKAQRSPRVRLITIRGRVLPATKKAIAAVVERRGINESEAVRRLIEIGLFVEGELDREEERGLW